MAANNDAALGEPVPWSASPPPGKRTKVQITMVMASLGSALFLAALDLSIVATMIPTMASELGSAQGYTWVGGAYTLGYAAGAPAWGKVSDVFGRKPVLLVAVAKFWAGSLLCGVASGMAMLMAGRTLQGLGGGGIVVLVNVCLGDLFSPRERGLYAGIMGMVWGLGGSFGPVAGGALASRVTWRWAFYANLPVAGLAFAVLLLQLDLHNPHTPLREGLAAVDWLGCFTIMAGTVMLLLGLEFGGVVRPWSSPTVVSLLAVGAVFMGLFVMVEARVARHPMVPPGLLGRRANLSALGVCFFHGMAALGMSYYLPLYFQAVVAASPLLSGVYVLPFLLAAAISGIASGFIMRRTGHFLPCIVLGLACMTLGIGLMISLGPQPSWPRLVIYQVVAGVGVGANFPAPLLALQAAVAKVAARDVAAATSAYIFLRQLATSASVVLGGVVFQNAMQRQEPELEALLGPEQAALLDGNNAAASIGAATGLQGTASDVARTAYWWALRDMFIMYAAMAGAALAAGLFLRQDKLVREHEEVKTGLQTLVPARGNQTAGEGGVAMSHEKKAGSEEEGAVSPA